MRVLVACEFSGRVRNAFRARGHDAISCDLEPTDLVGPHITGDVRAILQDDWDLIVAFPPCTYLSNANAFQGRQGSESEDTALDFVLEIMNAPAPRIAVENPLGAINRRIRRHDQIIQPYQFGHPWKKQTCLWLKNLPPLVPTNVIPGRHQSWTDAPGLTPKTRAKMRSLTFPGIAVAMAEQWGQ